MNTTTTPAARTDSSRRWRFLRRSLIVLAAFATLVAVFYTIENWRGKRAWEKRLGELKANGEIVDWANYIPEPVPDEQNVFKAPHMEEWFVRPPSTQLTSYNSFFVHPVRRNDTNLIIAEIKGVASDSASDSQPSDVVFQLDDPAVKEKVAAELKKTLEPCLLGSRGSYLVAKPLDQFKAPKWLFRAKSISDVKNPKEVLPKKALADVIHDDNLYVRVEPAPGASNTFRVVSIYNVYGAADYLEWTQSLEADADIVRQALQRPFARIDGDYSRPMLIPMVNWITIRNAAQVLSQRAQCHLLLNEPEAAWRDLELVYDLRRFLLRLPDRKPITVVGAMINTAIQGLYTTVVEDGLRLQVWREPQLRAIEDQLKNDDLIDPLVASIKEERVATAHTFETSAKMAEASANPRMKPFEKALAYLPRGWIYQNLVVSSKLMEDFSLSMDAAKQVVNPGIADNLQRELEVLDKKRSPYTSLTYLFVPNLVKALQVTARNQTIVNQARLACVLERYHLEKKEYPETLDALVPGFLEKIPHDVIGMKPLLYQRTTDGYKLYSIGWNQTDDKGTNGNTLETGDWVWERMPAK